MPKLSEIVDKIEGVFITTTKKAAGIMSETLTAIDNEIIAIVKAAEPAIKKDITTIMQDGIPVAWAAFNTGGISACVTAGIEFIKAELPTLGLEIQTALGAELAAKAKSLIPARVPTEAPAAIIPIPS